MRNFPPPTPLSIRTQTGINRFIERFDPEDIHEKLRDLRDDVEPEVEINVGAEVWNSPDLTIAQIRLAQRAWRYRTAAAYLLSPAIEMLTGTPEPLLMAAADEIFNFIDRLKAWAAELEGKLATGSAVPPVPEGEGFAMPYVRCSTYAPSASPTPSERIMDLDVRDDHVPVL